MTEQNKQAGMPRKTVWFVENLKGEWAVNKHNWTIDPNKAAKFKSENEAAEYIIHSELHDCKATEHEFVSPPPKSEAEVEEKRRLKDLIFKVYDIAQRYPDDRFSSYNDIIFEAMKELEGILYTQSCIGEERFDENIRLKDRVSELEKNLEEMVRQRDDLYNELFELKNKQA